MNFCIISGPHQPSKCGISDYVDLLSDELINRKHNTQKYSIESPKHFLEFAQHLPEADLCIIQFAPYSFSSSGCSGKSIFHFASVLSKKNVIVNFHEIWIGAYPKATWKESFIGWRQKREILKFLKLLNPKVIHSSNAAAIDRLQKEGVNAEFMYLFGNIPFNKCNRPIINSGKLKIVFFGTPYELFPYDILGQQIVQISKVFTTKIELKLIGKQRDGKGLIKLHKMARDYNLSLSVSNQFLRDEISKELQASSIGVSTTPYDIMGKSGTTAAMLEHGLPVLAYDDGDTPKERLFIPDQFKDQIFLINDGTSVENILKYIVKPRKPFFDGVAYTANKILELVS